MKLPSDSDDEFDKNEQQETFSILVKTSDSANIEITVVQTETVESVKRKYESITGKSTDLQRYIFRGIELSNIDTLHKYGIRKKVTIHAAIRKTEEELDRQRREEFAYLDDENENLNPFNLNDGIEPNLMDLGYFNFITCCTAYCTVCCGLPIFSLPDIVALIMVNDYNNNYDKHGELNECIWSSNYIMPITAYINIGALFAIVCYTLFALWVFWYLKISSFILVNDITAQELEFRGFRKIMASTRTMNSIWRIMAFVLVIWSIIGLIMYDIQMSHSCQSDTIGILLIIWCIIHLTLSFCACCSMSLASCFGLYSDNIFAHLQIDQ